MAYECHDHENYNDSPIPFCSTLGAILILNNVKSVFYKFLWIPSNGIHFTLRITLMSIRLHIIRKNLFDNMFILEFRIIIAKFNFFNSILIFIQLINFLWLCKIKLKDVVNIFFLFRHSWNNIWLISVL